MHAWLQPQLNLASYHALYTSVNVCLYISMYGRVKQMR